MTDPAADLLRAAQQAPTTVAEAHADAQEVNERVDWDLDVMLEDTPGVVVPEERRRLFEGDC